ncbi:MAG: nitroreductase family protein [Desulfobacterales bacterium]|nr:nitroreductase family protein [Desulfobacterales bacterium]
MLIDLIKKNRSTRRFKENKIVSLQTLKDLIELARLSASAANRQPLKYILSCEKNKNAEIFSCLAWAAYLKDWDGPKEGERPAAYIVILGDTEITDNFWCDHGIASQSILLGATEKGLSGCMLGAINKEKLKNILNISPKHQILLVLAIGEPAEEIVIDTVGQNNDIRYFRDQNNVHHVPKRKLEDLILLCYTP